MKGSEKPRKLAKEEAQTTLGSGVRPSCGDVGSNPIR